MIRRQLKLEVERPRRAKLRWLPLSMAREGSTVKVVDVVGCRNAVRRLHELGIMPGTRLRVVKTMSPGPVIVEVANSRFAIGYGMALKVMVEELEK